MRRLALLLVLLAGTAQAQDLAILRPQVTVEDAQIRLSDLFDNAGPNASRAIGPAPAPGRRIVVEPAQLFAIARANGVAWRPLTGADSVTVERPGRAIARDEVMDLLRADLIRLGMDRDTELELPGFSPPLVPTAAFAQTTIEGPTYDTVTNRFAATLVVVADGMPTQRLRLAGRALATAAVVVATRRLALNETVRPGDVRVVRQRAERVRPGLATNPAQVIGQSLRRPVAEGLPFATNDLSLPAAVERGATVTMLMESPGMTLTAQGRALEPAARGAVVPVMNLASRSIVEATVIGPGRVRVAFGGAPVGTVPSYR
ncbi:flagellar basal body P-ring formation chaperone FlgA [Muricoccus radiodurans]|uniref:flagellar basal body P-ring formation chaperone FlgA n=1 Tax=Muricoccus radiodurans TaxID=2231721 RepID=UPI003CF623A3